MLLQHAHCAWATTVIRLIIFVAYGACWVCLCCHNPLNSDMDYGIFILPTDVNACNCTWGCTDTEKESALKVDSGKKPPCRTRKLTVTVQCSNQLNYFPSPIKAHTFLCMEADYKVIHWSGVKVLEDHREKECYERVYLQTGVASDPLGHMHRIPLLVSDPTRDVKEWHLKTKSCRQKTYFCGCWWLCPLALPLLTKHSLQLQREGRQWKGRLVSGRGGHKLPMLSIAREKLKGTDHVNINCASVSSMNVTEKPGSLFVQWDVYW